MSLPQLLLVDDSEAVLAFEKAALSRHYDIRTATTGHEALQRLSQEQPAAVLLDLSMPEMDGDAVLAQMQADARLRKVPVIVVSSETQRAAECLAGGAKGFLPKPIRAPDLLSLVEKVIGDARAEASAGNLAVLFVVAGTIKLGLPLDCVRTVLHQTATRPLPLGPAYLSEMFELHGEPVAVLDLARRLGQEHIMPVHERKLVVVDCDGGRLALCLDDVRDPEELTAEELTPREKLAGTQHGLLQDALIAVARTRWGPLPIIDPRALVSRELLRKLAAALRPEAAT
ncbi:MAG: response regulator [Myxococcales bacterium]